MSTALPQRMPITDRLTVIEGRLRCLDGDGAFDAIADTDRALANHHIRCDPQTHLQFLVLAIVAHNVYMGPMEHEYRSLLRTLATKEELDVLEPRIDDLTYEYSWRPPIWLGYFEHLRDTMRRRFRQAYRKVRLF